MNTITMDLHTHLNEKNTLPEDYWNRVKEIKLDAVAITEHNYCNPKQAFEKLQKTKPENVILIPGMELTTSVGHVLIYATNEKLYEEIELMENGADIERVIEISKKNKFYLSLAHPFGYENDSVCFIANKATAKKLIGKGCGIEIYNGLISHLSNFLFDSNWITKPFNFLSFLEKNFVSRNIGLGKVGVKIKDSFDSKRQDILMRCINSIELGKEAEFVTAGSDAHSADRIGTGIMKIKFEQELNPQNILEALKQKENIIWSGPLIKETEKGVYEKVEDPLTGKEIAQGIKYITTEAVKKRSRKMSTEKIRNKIKDRINENRITKKIRKIRNNRKNKKVEE